MLDLPSRHDEDWRWSRLDALPELAAADHGEAENAAQHLIGLGGPQLVFVDGVFDESASDLGRVRVDKLDLASDHPLGKQARGAGWNLSLGTDQATDPIEIVHIATGGANHLPARIALGEDAVASVVETYVGEGWSNRLTQSSSPARRG